MDEEEIKREFEMQNELDNLGTNSTDPFTQGWIEALTWAHNKGEKEIQKKLDSFPGDGNEKTQGWITALSWALGQLPEDEGKNFSRVI
jgi:hypothetical protein